MRIEDRGPGVPFPPPLVFVAGWLVAWLLNTRIDFVIHGTGPGGLQLALGTGLAAAGLLLIGAGLVTFVLARTAVMPTRAARQLVAWGPYRFTRNPMYVGLTGLYLGLTLLLNMAWPLVTLPGVLVVMTAFVIRREERHLRRAFGDDYEAYCLRVRRWL
jgi:protein-S-isoprenylcysteine O-methyltransferase Ste14